MDILGGTQATNLSKDAVVTRNKAMQLLEISRHSFEKIVKDGLISYTDADGKKYYSVTELKTFMGTDKYKELVNGAVDSRNNLNDLTEKSGSLRRRASFIRKDLAQIIRKLRLKNFIQHRILFRILVIL